MAYFFFPQYTWIKVWDLVLHFVAHLKLLMWPSSDLSLQYYAG